MLALVQHQMVLLEKCFAAFANVRAQCAAAVRMPAIVLQETVFSRESFAARCAKVCFRLLLWCCEWDKWAWFSPDAGALSNVSGRGAYLLRQRFVVGCCGAGQLDGAAVAGDVAAAAVDSVRLNCKRAERSLAIKQNVHSGVSHSVKQ